MTLGRDARKARAIRIAVAAAVVALISFGVALSAALFLMLRRDDSWPGYGPAPLANLVLWCGLALAAVSACVALGGCLIALGRTVSRLGSRRA